VLIRTVTDMRVSEVSVVTFPAYTQTDVAVAQRSMQAYQETQANRITYLLRWHKTKMAR